MKKFTRIGAAAAAIVIAGFSLTACGSKEAGTPAASGSSASSAATNLTIAALTEIDAEGKPVTAAAGAAPAVDPAGDGNATCTDMSFGMMGPLTGPNAALGQNILNGAQMAVDEHNTKNPNCQVTINKYDSEGDPQKGTQLAPQAISTQSNIALLGPTFSGVTKAVGPTFQQAKMAMLSGSATNPDLTKAGWTVFFRGVAPDSLQGPSVAKWMMGEKGFKKVCVVSDNGDYGVGIAKAVKDTLGSVAVDSCSQQIKAGDKDFSALANAIKAAAPDAVYFGGYYAEAGLIVRAMSDAGVEATFVSDDGVKDPEFLKAAGAASSGSLLSCPCGPASEDFETRYTAAFNAPSGTYSVEGYDLATIILTGIDSGITDRAKMVEYIKNYDGQGVGRHYSFTDTGELKTPAVWTYEVK
ncbi:branched-chain amino acid ABC transporter substrate-binding protein [Micrococcales bacterium 31B]|nr:branched-chain amino acid ABC transporter substrate-binding protein [Micrococcales bacterium 31B]